MHSCHDSGPLESHDIVDVELKVKVLLEPEYVEKNGLGACNTSGNISELAIMDYLKASAEYFEWDTPVAKVSMEYVCGTPPACPAKTHCVMSDTEFAAEYGRFKLGLPFPARIAPLPYEERWYMLTSAIW